MKKIARFITLLSLLFVTNLFAPPYPVPVVDSNQHPESKAIVKAGAGTGFWVSSDGYMITNRHVVRYFGNVTGDNWNDAIEIEFYEKKSSFSGGLFEGRAPKKIVVNSSHIVAIDSSADWALIKVDLKAHGIESVPYLEVLTSPPELGEKIKVIGFPSDNEGSQQRIAKGSTEMSQSFSPSEKNKIVPLKMVQSTEAKISEGFSGSPMIVGKRVLGLVASTGDGSHRSFGEVTTAHATTFYYLQERFGLVEVIERLRSKELHYSAARVFIKVREKRYKARQRQVDALTEKYKTKTGRSMEKAIIAILLSQGRPIYDSELRDLLTYECRKNGIEPKESVIECIVERERAKQRAGETVYKGLPEITVPRLKSLRASPPRRPKMKLRRTTRLNSVVVPMSDAWIEGDIEVIKRDIMRGAEFTGKTALGGFGFLVGEYGSEAVIALLDGDFDRISHLKLVDVLKSYGSLTVGSGIGSGVVSASAGTVKLTSVGRRFAQSAAGGVAKNAAKKVIPLYFGLLALELIREGEISPLKDQVLGLANVIIGTGAVKGLLTLGKALYYSRKGVKAVKAVNLPAVTPQTIAITGVKVAATSILDFLAIKGLGMLEQRAVLFALEHNLKVQIADACINMDTLVKKFEEKEESLTVGDLLLAKDALRDAFLMYAQFKNPLVYEVIRLKVSLEAGEITLEEFEERMEKIYENIELPKRSRYIPFSFDILKTISGDALNIEFPEPALNTEGKSIFTSGIFQKRIKLDDNAKDGASKVQQYFEFIYNNLSEASLEIIRQYEDFIGTRMFLVEQISKI